MAFTKGARKIQTTWFKRNEQKILYDRLLQRNYVWTEEQQKDLIDSIIRGYPIDELHAREDDNDQLWILDGQQRITTILRFMHDEFSTFDNSEPVEIDEQIYNFAGLKYNELPPRVKSKFNEEEHRIRTYQNMTNKEVREMFRRRNAGSHLNKVELLRSLLSKEVMDVIGKIVEQPFFGDSISISDKQKNRLLEQEVVMQTITLFVERESGEYPHLGYLSYSKCMIELNQNGIPEKIQEDILNAVEYLNDALPVKQNFIKKVHIPMIILTAKQAKKDGVSAEKFGGLIQSFFSGKRGSSGSFEYNNAADSKSTSKENVKIRCNVIMNYYHTNKDSAPDYVKPEPKESKGKGAPRTKTDPKPQVDPNSTVYTGYEVLPGTLPMGEVAGDAVH